MITRRRLLHSGAALALASPALSALAQPAVEPRLVVMILRGGLDGLAAVPAYGDADYHRARGGLVEPMPGEPDGILDLDGFFGLHSRLANLHDFYHARELLVAHAVAPPYRARSHFDAQDVLEAGIEHPSGTSDGWLYRALSLLPGNRSPQHLAMALGGAVPLILRGSVPVAVWAPDALPQPDDDTLRRVLALYQEDPVLGPSLNSGFEAQAMLGETALSRRGDGLSVSVKAAAGFLRHPEGPRIAVLEAGGWDTHANQPGQLANRLGNLDSALALLKQELGSIWSHTLVIVVTEFGRTVAMNGTRGSDHGVGGVAFLCGGVVNGGRVMADWPGLKSGDLYQGRDLMPTTDLRSLCKTILVAHLGLDARGIDQRVFPDANLPVVHGLIRV